MNPQTKSNLIWLTVVIVCSLILLVDFVSSNQSESNSFDVISKENKTGNICVEQNKKSLKTEITDITEPLTMVEISQVISQSNLKANKKECFQIVKEYTKLNGKEVKSELKLITKK